MKISDDQVIKIAEQLEQYIEAPEEMANILSLKNLHDIRRRREIIGPVGSVWKDSRGYKNSHLRPELESADPVTFQEMVDDIDTLLSGYAALEKGQGAMYSLVIKLDVENHVLKERARKQEDHKELWSVLTLHYTGFWDLDIAFSIVETLQEKGRLSGRLSEIASMWIGAYGDEDCDDSAFCDLLADEIGFPKNQEGGEGA
ncbi:hypothetical protein [Tumebacillus flagellatus]|uniref:Uncharacterized protein n=1 Tax=Tumebacillus flagellatus TaxID=1157490 RepID=A0A074M472_9BACL|nr:hypothetical protein [Tumebacillus flagellatus]KEO80802.1 hypothetical protein EL26_24365 [Tumebacillus flagellatus]